jgi:hypothetical protein
MRERLSPVIGPGRQLIYSGRPVMAAPSGGDYHRHLERQRNLVDFALGIAPALEPGDGSRQNHGHNGL